MNAVMADAVPEEIANRIFVERTRSWRLMEELGEKKVVIPPAVETETPGA